MYDTEDEIAALRKLDVAFETFVSSLNGPPDEVQSIQTRRRLIDARIKAVTDEFAIADSSTSKTQIAFPASDGTHQVAFLYKPVRPSTDRPLIVLFHGGGFCLGTAEAEEEFCRLFCKSFDAICVTIGYRLAPEHKFPTAPTDAWDALKYSAATAKTWGANLEKGFIVGGTSAGGNLAAGLAHRARDEGLEQPLTGQFLLCPWLGSGDRVPHSYKKLYLSHPPVEDRFVLPTAIIKAYEEAYAMDFNDDRFDVISHSNGHHDLPPTYIVICGADPFGDGNLIYSKMLREEGIETKIEVFPGMPHSYWNFYPTFPGTEAAKNKILRGMEWLLTTQDQR